MRKASVFLMILFLSGCAASHEKRIPKQRMVPGVNLKKYKDKGFVITPGGYSKNYEPIGYLYYTVFPETKTTTRRVETTSHLEIIVIRWITGEMDFQEVLDEVYEIAASKGADALIRLKMELVDDKPAHNPVLRGTELSGLLIKRK
jgi:hypothetical protein